MQNNLKLNLFIYNFYKRFQNLIQYCLIGCMGVAIDFLIYILLVKNTSMHYQVINIISTSCGICNNFIWNAFFNFKIWNHFLLRFVSFYCVGSIGIAITYGMLYVLVEQLLISTIIAKLITIFIVTIIQFLLNKFITFYRRGGI